MTTDMYLLHGFGWFLLGNFAALLVTWPLWWSR